MRASSYLIAAPLRGQPAHILMHGVNGAVDKVSSTYGQALLDGRGRDIDTSDWDPDAVGLLRQRGYLTDLTADQERSNLEQVARFLHDRDLLHRPGNFVLIPSYQCNLRCYYCFQSHDMHAGHGAFEQTMTLEMIEAAFRVIDDFAGPGAVPRHLGFSNPDLDEITCSGDHSPDITLFGGEPLRASLAPTVQAIVERARARGLRVGAITNGVELDAYTDLLGEDAIAEIQVTLDGPREVHDRRRIGPGLPATFDRIAANLTMALDRGVTVGLRINVDQRNAEAFLSLEAEIARRGWSSYGHFHVQAAEVHPSWGSAPNQREVSGATLVQLTTKERSRAAVASGAIKSYEDTAKTTLLRCLKGDTYPFAEGSSTFCGAEGGMLILDCLGDVYACWEQAGQPDMRTGTYSADGLRLDHAKAAEWLNRFPGTVDECLGCPYALIHKSGCADVALRRSGSIFAPACESFQEYFPATLAAAWQDVEDAVLSVGRG
jgi:uncharacterized protein